MARGLVSGMITGIVVSGIVLGAASLMGDAPGSEPPEAVALEVPAGSEFDQSREDREAEMPSADDSPDPARTPKVGAPAPDDLRSMEGADLDPAAQPETGTATSEMSGPESAGEGAGLDLGAGTTGSGADSSTAQRSDAPEAPEDDGTPAISTDPAQPAAPDASDETGAFGDDPAEDADAGTAAEDDGASADENSGTASDGNGAGADPGDAGTADPAEDETAATEANGAVTGSADTAAGDDEAAEPGLGSGTIDDLAPDVATNRLPSVGDEPEAEPVEEAPAPAPPAIEEFAAPFEAPQDRPLMAIVLIDDGSSPIGLDALESFPYPLSFAIDAAWDGAASAARRYREAGFEVLAMADLPAGARAADTEVAMQTVLDAVPGAVAVMEGTGTGLQSGREAAGQLAPILLDSGHGLVLFSSGLDTTRKLAERAGVPAATVFRDFDGDGQEASVIRRVLDQAAFKARQEDEGIVMVGRLRADTVSALLLWGLQDRASEVALAPVSAVLMAGTQ